MLRHSRYSYLFIWAGILVVAILVIVFGKSLNKDVEKADTKVVSYSDSEDEVSYLGDTILVQGEQGAEMVGLWVPYMSLATETKNEEEFKKGFAGIVEDAKRLNVNALFVHVRPFSDALYPSEHFTWSHVITGEQGKDPGYDPLKYMIEYTHENNMQFHAWINPLRVKSNADKPVLSQDNIYEELKGDYPFYFMNYDGGIYLNPSYPYIRQVISSGAVEIVKNYDVDGIHFDDYFYPSQDESLDSEAYASYKQTVENPLSLAQWRTANINAMIAKVYEDIKKEKSNVVFGISPAGNINNLEKINADVKTWCAVTGYIDYICPQLYYSYENDELTFGKALEEWVEVDRHENLKMYIGLALYKAGSDDDNGTWKTREDIIKNQILDSRKKDCDGVILYSSDYINKEETKAEVTNAAAVLKEEKE